MPFSSPHPYAQLCLGHASETNADLQKLKFSHRVTAPKILQSRKEVFSIVSNANLQILFHIFENTLNYVFSLTFPNLISKQCFHKDYSYYFLILKTDVFIHSAA